MNQNDLLSIPPIPEKAMVPSDLDDEEIYEWVMYSMTCLGSILRAYAHHRVKTREFIVYVDETKTTILNALISIGCTSRRDARYHEVDAKIKELRVYSAILRSIRYIDVNANGNCA